MLSYNNLDKNLMVFATSGGKTSVKTHMLEYKL